jgi:glycosyltransferase involved in cell wall biosynthesis
VQTVYNGLNLAEVDRLRRAPLNGPVPEHSGPVVAIVGAICPEKGQEILIRSLPEIVREVPDLSCWIIGDEIYETSRHSGGVREGLERQAASLGVSGQTHFLGWREDVIGLLERADILVCTTNPTISKETFGRTIAEAMACGKPVVAVAHGGPREMVVDGITGTLLRTYAPDHLASAIVTLARDKDRMVRMGRAGRERAEALFTIEEHVRGVQDFLARITGQNTSRMHGGTGHS